MKLARQTPPRELLANHRIRKRIVPGMMQGCLNVVNLDTLRIASSISAAIYSVQWFVKLADEVDKERKRLHASLSVFLPVGINRSVIFNLAHHEHAELIS
jgi:hypothetical protein